MTASYLRYDVPVGFKVTPGPVYYGRPAGNLPDLKISVMLIGWGSFGLKSLIDHPDHIPEKPQPNNQHRDAEYPPVFFVEMVDGQCREPRKQR
jgi:hypothetical protein